MRLTCRRSYNRVCSHPQYIRHTQKSPGVCSRCTVSYSDHMTSKGTPGRMVRIEDDVWEDYEKVCKEKGLARAADIRTYVVREVAAWRRRQRAEARDSKS